MTTFDKLCRICSSPGEYEFFDIIPAYLHGNHNDFLSWQRPVNEMMEETTGLKTSPTDGLPSRVCALCISYLKHAVTFRQQAVRNALSLKAIAVLLKENGDTAKSAADKNSLLITEQDLDVSVDRQVDTNLLANQEQKTMAKQLLNNRLAVTLPSADELEQQMRYLNILFDRGPSKRPPPDNNNFYGRQGGVTNSVDTPGLADIFEDVAEESSPTTDEEQPTDSDKSAAKHNIFSYTEKPFQEDDIMESDYLRGIVTEPKETFKERKCRACSKRFMFEYTHQQHMNVCIEYQFLAFVEEVNRLLFIRQRKAISPHEFIRRMIFCLRKTCEWLKESNCGEIGLPNLNEVGEKRPDNGQQRPADPPGDPQKLEEAKKILSRKIVEVFLQAQTKEHVDHLARQAVESSRLTKFLKASRNSELDESQCRDYEPHLSEALPAFLQARAVNPQLPLPPTPINRSNNILYEIERSQSRSSYSTDTRSIDEFCAAPVMPSASISNEHLRKPIAIMARNPNQPSGIGSFNRMEKLAVGGESPAKPPQQILSHLEMESELLSKQTRKNSMQTALEVEQAVLSRKLEQLQRKREEDNSLQKRESQAEQGAQHNPTEAMAKLNEQLIRRYEKMMQPSKEESQRPQASQQQIEAMTKLNKQFKRQYENMMQSSQAESQQPQATQPNPSEALAQLTEHLKRNYEKMMQPSQEEGQRPQINQQQIEVAKISEQLRMHYEKSLQSSQAASQLPQINQQQIEVEKLEKTLKIHYEKNLEASIKSGPLAKADVAGETQRRLQDMFRYKEYAAYTKLSQQNQAKPEERLPSHEDQMKQSGKCPSIQEGVASRKGHSTKKGFPSSEQVEPPPENTLKHRLIEQEILAKSRRSNAAEDLQRTEQKFEIPILQKQLSHKELQREILRQNQLQIQAQQRNKLLEDKRREQEELRKAQRRQTQAKLDNSSAQNAAAELAKTFTAHCNPCGMHFESLTTLEVHNAQYHNAMVKAAVAAGLQHVQQTTQPVLPEENNEYSRIIAMFD